MKKIFLTLASISLFQLATILASEPELPTLPPQEIASIADNKGEKSFWNKVVDFLGLSKEPEQKPIKDKPKENQDSATLGSVVTETPEIQTPVIQDNTEPLVSIVPKQVIDDNIKLELPSGFEPEKEEELPTPRSQTNKTSELISIEAVKVNQTKTEENGGIQKSIDDSKIITIPDTIEIKSPEPIEGLEKIDSISKQKQTFLDQANNAQPIKIANSDVSKYRKQLQQRLDQAQNVPEIPQLEIETPPSPLTPSVNNITTTNIEEDPNQIKFINNELQVLKLPNDDIVLGEITEEATIELIDFSSYVPIFWKNYNIVKNEPARKIIDDFILDYDSRIIKPTKGDISNAFIEAFKAIDSDSIYSLINLVEHYPILQIVDKNGNNLLHKAVYAQNYSAVKFLLMKGIALSSRNDEGYTPSDIALSLNNKSIILLLHTSGAN